MYLSIFDLSEKIDLDTDIMSQFKNSEFIHLPKNIRTVKGKRNLDFDLSNEDIAELSDINVLFTYLPKGGYLVNFKTDQLK